MHYEVIPDSEEERQRYVQGLSVVIPNSFLNPWLDTTKNARGPETLLRLLRFRLLTTGL